jgi:hypothetical protein
LKGADWLYDEIYRTESGYEIHVLLGGKYDWENIELIDFVFHAADIEYK